MSKSSKSTSRKKKVLQVLGLPYLQRQFPTHTSITQSRNPRQNPLSQGMCDETGTVCIIEDPMHAMSPPVCTKIETSEESQHQYATLVFFFWGRSTTEPPSEEADGQAKLAHLGWESRPPRHAPLTVVYHREKKEPRKEK